ncbi:MAG: DUF2206 domain-containing protein [Dehalococcoidales bacterium]|jgi:uncharacterized membrane protein|nr:DUF2206 domain-containing protein [Dehalococcoidales bacterium]
MTPPNDWPIKKCLGLSLIILLAILGLTGLAGVGFDVPGLRQMVGFILLTFIPGVLILRILRIHDVGMIESLLYSVGLSLAFVIFCGVVANYTWPVFGVSRPISAFPIMVTLTIFTLILMSVAYQRDKSFAVPVLTSPAAVLSPAALFLILVFLLAVIGALMVNFYQNNILLLIFTAVVAGIVGLAVFGKFIDQKVYALAIVIIAVCLLYQTTLISPYLTGFDIHLEYYFPQLIVENGYWDATRAHGYNTALSLTMLVPIYSLVLDIDGVWVFKTISPFVFALVPLTLFHVFRQQMSPRKAFLAAFFFMAVPTFSLEMVALIKQQFAEFFFALVILILVDRKLGLGQRLTLAIVFSMSIIVSHYGVGGICLIYFIIAWLLIATIRNSWGRKVWGWLTSKTGGLSPNLISPSAFPLKVLSIIVAVYVISSTAYYGSVGGGGYISFMASTVQKYAVMIIPSSESPTPEEPAAPVILDPWMLHFLSAGSFSSVEGPAPPRLSGYRSSLPPVWEVAKVQVHSPRLIRLPLIRLPSIPPPPVWSHTLPPALGFFGFTTHDPFIQAALGLDFASASSQGKAFRVLQYIAQLFLAVGFIRLILVPRKMMFTAEYIALSVGSALLLVASVVLPGFADRMNATRFYHIALLLLAPLFIMGGEGIWLGVRALMHKAGTVSMTGDNQVYLRLVTLVVLIPYFLSTSGFIFEVTKHEVIDRIDAPYSYALSSPRIDIGGVFNRQDGVGADWIRPRLSEEDTVYADLFGWLLLGHESAIVGDPARKGFDLVKISSWRTNIFGAHPTSGLLPLDTALMPQDSYLYFRTRNIQRQELTTYVNGIVGARKSVSFSEAGVNYFIESRNRIYNNGGAQVLINRADW